MAALLEPRLADPLSSMWYFRCGGWGNLTDERPPSVQGCRELVQGVLAAWSRHGDVLVYLDNDWEGFAPANAATLRVLLTDSFGDIPEGA